MSYFDNNAAYVKVETSVILKACDRIFEIYDYNIEARKNEWFKEMKTKTTGILWWKRPYTLDEINQIWETDNNGWGSPRERVENRGLYAVKFIPTLQKMCDNSSDGFIMVNNQIANIFLERK